MTMRPSSPNFLISIPVTTQKMKFSIKDFFSKCDQSGSFLMETKFLMENFIFSAVAATRWY